MTKRQPDEPPFCLDDQQPQLWLSGSKASRHGWVRVCDGTERVFYHSMENGKITLERPAEFGDDNPTWADGKCLVGRDEEVM